MANWWGNWLGIWTGNSKGEGERETRVASLFTINCDHPLGNSLDYSLGNWWEEKEKEKEGGSLGGVDLSKTILIYFSSSLRGGGEKEKEGGSLGRGRPLQNQNTILFFFVACDGGWVWRVDKKDSSTALEAHTS